MKWIARVNLVTILLFVPFLTSANEDLLPFEISAFDSHLFDIKSDKKFKLELDIKEKVKLQIDICSADGDVAKTLFPINSVEKGKLSLIWDGSDKSNELVPNEAWFPVVRYMHKGKLISIESRDYSGGEIVEQIPLTVQSNNRIQVNLDKPSRLLIRAGVKSGAMLRTIESWRAMNAGSHVIQWDGLDTSRVYPFTGLKDFALMATAYQLPQHSIVTWGNDSLSYPEWRVKNRYPIAQANARPKINQVRGDNVLSKVFSKPKYLPLDPKVMMDFEHSQEKDEAIVRVNIPEAHRGIIENSLYEVGFFIDGEFVSEEEQGYVPFVWKFKPSNYSKGQHYLTVNITGFDGQVGVASTMFNIE